MQGTPTHKLGITALSYNSDSEMILPHTNQIEYKGNRNTFGKYTRGDAIYLPEKAIASSPELWELGSRTKRLQ